MAERRDKERIDEDAPEGVEGNIQKEDPEAQVTHTSGRSELRNSLNDDVGFKSGGNQQDCYEVVKRHGHGSDLRRR